MPKFNNMFDNRVKLKLQVQLEVRMHPNAYTSHVSHMQPTNKVPQKYLHTNNLQTILNRTSSKSFARRSTEPQHHHSTNKSTSLTAQTRRSPFQRLPHNHAFGPNAQRINQDSYLSLSTTTSQPSNSPSKRSSS